MLGKAQDLPAGMEVSIWQSNRVESHHHPPVDETTGRESETLKRIGKNNIYPDRAEAGSEAERE